MTDNTPPDAALNGLKKAMSVAKRAYEKASRAETEARNKAFDAKDRLEEATIALAEAELKGQGILLGKCLVNLYCGMRPKVQRVPTRFICRTYAPDKPVLQFAKVNKDGTPGKVDRAEYFTRLELVGMLEDPDA